MHLAGAVVNPKRAHVLEDAHDDGLRGHALTAEHLHAAIDHAPDRFGDEDLAHARFEIAAAALIEHPGRVPDRQARGLQNEIGRASCRERVCENGWMSVVAVSLKKKK